MKIVHFYKIFTVDNSKALCYHMKGQVQGHIQITANRPTTFNISTEFGYYKSHRPPNCIAYSGGLLKILMENKINHEDIVASFNR